MDVRARVCQDFRMLKHGWQISISSEWLVCYALSLSPPIMFQALALKAHTLGFLPLITMMIDGLLSDLLFEY